MSALPHLKKALLVLILPALFSACTKQQQAAAPPPMPVVAEKISEIPVADASEYMATLISRRSVTLQSQVMGQIRAIYVKAGDFVTQGQTLMLVDPDRQQASVMSAGAAAQSQQAAIEQARENLRVLEEQRGALESAVQVAKSQYDRYNGLALLRSASQQSVEEYKDELTQAQADLQAHMAQVQAQRAAIATAQRQYQQAQAATNEQQVQLQYHRIKAPFSGYVGDIPVKLGNFVQPLTSLLSVTDNNPLELNLSVPAERAPDLRVGLPVEILSGQGAVIGRTTLSFVSPRVDQQAQTILVKAVLENPEGRLKADQLMNVRLVWKQQNGLKVPTRSVVHMGGRDFVYVMEPAGKGGFVARQRPVELGRIEGAHYVINSGLKPRESLIISGIQKLADGAPVTPQS